MSRLRRLAPWLALVVGLLLVGVVAGDPDDEGPPLDPRSTAPDGTKGLVDVLGELGADVQVTDRVPDAGRDAAGTVALVLRDDLADGQRIDLDRWVRAGGTLVVTDPGSSLHPGLAVEGVGAPFGPDDIAQGVCTVEALRAVERVDPGSAVRYRAVPGGEQCLGTEEAAFVLVVPQGQGTVVAVGGPGAFVNERLDVDDNAVLAAALLAPSAGARVVVLERALPGEGDETLADLVPGRVRDALVQLGVAFVVLVLWRGRRLGRPVPESGVLDVPGSELVEAAGRLRRRAGHPDRAAALLRADVRRRLASRLGLPSATSVGDVAVSAASHAGLDPERTAAVLATRPVASEDDLLRLAGDLEDLWAAVAGAGDVGVGDGSPVVEPESRGERR